MTDEFTKETIKRFGARGSPVYEQEQKTTDLDGLTERVKQTGVPFCEAGHPIMTAPGDVYRCVECEALCCDDCRIEISRYTYCPMCARHRFDLDKRTFLSLVFLQHDLMAPDDLIDVTTLDGEVVEIGVDATANAVLANDYLTDDGGLSAAGREALHVGKQLYGDDGDVQAVMDQIQMQKVVHRE